MRFTTSLISAALLASLGTVAMAQEGVQDSTWIPPSVKSRAEVRAETLAANRAGSLARNEYDYTVAAPATPSALTRIQVLAEAREAIRLGLVPVQEGQYRTATPAENELIRQAGLRAINTGSQFAGK